MVPLESVTERSRDPEPVFVPREVVREPRPEQPKPNAPHRFRVVDVMTRQSLLDDGEARDAVAALKGVRSVVDVNVYVWQEDRGRWRPLTFGEQRALQELARR